MKKVKNYFIIIAIIAIILIPVQVKATSEWMPDPNPSITEDEEGNYVDILPIDEELSEDLILSITNDIGQIIDNDVYIVSGNIDFKDMVFGNVYLVGEDVKVTSKFIDGNLFVIGNDITIDAEYIVGSIYLIGNNITFKGETKSIYAISNTFELEKGASILRDIRLIADTTRIKGYISKSIYAMTSNLNISNDARITENLNYISENEILVPEGTVAGQINFTSSDSFERDDSYHQINYLTNIITSIVTILIIALIVLFCTPKFIEIKKKQEPISKLFISAGIGLITLILIPIISIMLLISVVGVPMGFILIFAYIILLMIASAIANIVITSRIINKAKPEMNSKLKFIGILILVSLVIKLIGKIPFIGWLIVVIVYLSGIGEIVSYMFGRCKKEEIKEEAKKELKEETKEEK